MRERSGTRTEHARRKTPKHLIATTLVTGASMVAAPSAAVPAQPDLPDQPGTKGAAAPPVPVTPAPGAPAGAAGTDALTGDADTGADTDTDVEKIDVPRVDAGQSSPSRQPEEPVVASLEHQATAGFSLVGVTWRPGTAPDDVEVEVRTRDEQGWSAWRHLHFEPDEGPAPEEEDGAVREGTTPLWVGAADGVEARILSTDGTAPRDPELALVDPGSNPTSAASTAGHAGGDAAAATPAVLTGSSNPVAATSVATSRPRMVSRRGWGADPRMKERCSAPRRARTVQMAFVHHTAGSNSYSRPDSPAIVRSIYAYHTQGHGWCDIGYNFLVDRYGTVYVGRAGGPNTPVRGAHAGDYNVKTVGVSLMGNFQNAPPTRAMKRGLTRLLAWKLSSYYRYPRTRARISGTRFEKISGHRDAMSTACPGRYVYDWLPQLRRRVANRAGTIETPVSRKWKALRSNGTNLGQPFRGEADSANGGRKTQFGRGWVFWNSGPGAHPVRHRIFQRYRAYGQAAGRLGYPRSDVWRTKGYRGTNQAFQGGRIYRTRGYGAAVIWGRIDRRFQRTGLADGRLGVPVRDQWRVKRGWRAEFEHGRIGWNTRTGRTWVKSY